MKIFNSKAYNDRRRSLRQEMPKAEQVLWYWLRNRQLKAKFRRQYSVGAYVVDFYCPEFKLAIEIDGDSHFDESSRIYDDHRDRTISDLGIKILRFTNIEVYDAIDSVLDRIKCQLRSQNPL